MVRAPRACNEGRARTENRGGHRGGKTAGQHERDRKSTRLNSSHDQISYAVFCLKKKKIRKVTQILLDVHDIGQLNDLFHAFAVEELERPQPDVFSVLDSRSAHHALALSGQLMQV